MKHTARPPFVAALLACLLLPITGTVEVAAARGQAPPSIELSTLPIPGDPLEIYLLDSEAPPDSLVASFAVGVSPAGAAAEQGVRTSLRPQAYHPLTVAPYDVSNPPPSPEACIAESGNDVDESCYNVFLGLTGTDADNDVTATVTVVESEGLHVDPLVASFAITGQSTELARFAVRGTTPGLHTLTFEVTAAGSEPQRLSLPYVWQAGGEPIAGTTSLAGQMYGRNGLDSYACNASARCDFRTSDRVVFADGRRATRALAVNGELSCAPKRRCQRYHFNETSGLLQVGATTIGRIVPDNESPHGTFLDGERYTRLVYPERGARLDGLWLYGAHVDEGRGVVEQRLSLRENGRFRLYYAVDTHRYPESGLDSAYSRTLRGRYQIGRNGRIAFKDSRRGTKVATLAVAANGRGKPIAGKGVWLDLVIDPPDAEPFVDGNLLDRLPR